MSLINEWSITRVAGALLCLDENKKLFSTGNRMDGIILCDLVKSLKTKKQLTYNQLDSARARLEKYSKILETLEFDDYIFPLATKGASNIPTLKLHNPHKFRVYIDPKSTLFKQTERSVDLQVKFKRNYYLCTANKRHAYRLLNLGFTAEKRIYEFLDKDEPSAPELKEISGFGLILSPYQKEGVSFLLNKHGRVLLADEMGLGKTIQAIAYCQASNQSKVLVLMPASVKMNWQKEIIKSLGSAEKDKIVVLSGKKPTTDNLLDAVQARWVLINYDILSSWVDSLKALKFTCAIADECHMITAKSLSSKKASQRGKASSLLLKKIKHVICVSGTPIENRPSEFYSLLNLLDSCLFPRRLNYQIRYCDGKNGRFGWEAKGATNQDELNKILTSTLMLRRLKKDVLKDLPEKTRVPILIELSAKDLKEYRSIETDFKSWLKQNYTDKKRIQKALHAQALTKRALLRQKVALAKIPAAIEWIDNYLESESKLVVFAHHKPVVSALRDHYKDRCVVIDGSVPPEKRQILVDKFQEDAKIELFIGNLQAAGTGITLTAAKDTLTLELGWTSSKHDQAEDRVHRIGQKNAVTAYYLLALDTIDVTSMADIIDFKRDNLSQILDGKSVDFGDNLLDAFLKDNLDKEGDYED